MDVAGWARHTSRQACIAEAQQYKSEYPGGYIPYTEVAAGAGSLPHLSAI